MNLTSILNGLMSGGARPRSPLAGMLGGAQAPQSANPLAGLLGSVLGGGSAGAAGGILGGVLGGGSIGGRGQPSGNGLASIAGSLFGGGSGGGGMLGTAGRMGGLALLAGLAAQLLGANANAPSPQQAAEQMAALPQPEADRIARLMITAMVNAAKADGHVSQEEVKTIIDRLDDDGLSEEEKQFVRSELQAPFDLDGLVAAVGPDPLLAAQVYTASAMAIEADTVAEQEYLRILAQRLGLEGKLAL